MVAIIIIIIISTLAVRHVCVCSSVKRQEDLCRNVCVAAQYAVLFLTFDGTEWSTSGPCLKSPLDRRLLGPGGSLNAVEREKSHAFTGN